MTRLERGDIVLVRFIFADERGAKRRPVLVLSGDAYHRGRREVVVAAITSNVRRVLTGDHEIRAWKASGLPRPSVVAGILRTIKADMIERSLGRLAKEDMATVEARVREVLEL